MGCKCAVPCDDKVRKLSEQLDHLLRDTHFTAVNIVGPRGCGKTSLIATSLSMLGPGVRAGALICGGVARHDAQCLVFSVDRAHQAGRVVEIPESRSPCTDLGRLLAALHELDVRGLDVLFTENISPTLAPFWSVIPRVLHVAMSSPDTDEPTTRIPLASPARFDAAVLNKTDLARRAPAPEPPPADRRFECSLLNHAGLDRWARWIGANIPLPADKASAWFG
ncbi:MAG: hypothetical protein NTW19_20810 [Planctomycetota bacterium]|nr:hypothetical protein [Planctomycetota bacterium]